MEIDKFDRLMGEYKTPGQKMMTIFKKSYVLFRPLSELTFFKLVDVIESRNYRAGMLI